jgi:hypothetical protein
MDWLFTREMVIVLAILGAIPAVAASLLRTGGKLSEQRVCQLNVTGYGFMAASMLLFIVIGFQS